MRGGATPWRWLAGLMAGPLVLAAACAQSSHARLTPPPRIATWDGDDLLPAAGEMTRAGRIGVYFAVDGDRYTLAAIDVTTGRELWRRPVDQHDRPGGATQRPAVDGAGHRVYATVVDAGTGAPEVAAFDLRSGAEVWRAPSGWAITAPWRCGPASVCLSTLDGSAAVYDLATGRRQAVPSPPAGPRIASGGDYVVTATVGRQIEMGRYGAGGYARVWRASIDDLFGPAVGPTVEPGGGWAGTVDPTTGASVLALGPVLPANRRATDAAERARVARAFSVTFVSPGGRRRAVVDRVELCGTPPFVEAVLLCSVALPPDRPLAAPTVLTALQGRSLAGRLRWDLPLGLAGRWGGPLATTDPGEVALWAPGAPRPRLLGADDGARRTGPLPRDLLVSCGRPASQDEALVHLRTHHGDTKVYARNAPSGGLCTAAGTRVGAATVLGRGGLVPGWFGFTVPEGSRHSRPDRWAVWVDPDGTLHGAGPG